MTNIVQFPGLGLEFELDRVAFTIGDMNIYWYGLLIATGLMLALVFAFRYAVDFGIDADRLVDVILIGTVCAVVCARAYYVIFSPVPYDSIWDMINIRNGGLAIYGGVIGAAVFGSLACKWRKLPILNALDLTSMGFLIGQCIGRWGNFVNQEAFGSNTDLPWGMYSEGTRRYLESWQAELATQGVEVNPMMPVHPTFLYESLWCAAGFFMLWAFMKKRHFNGEIALLYAVWYGAGRFWIEGLRTDSLIVPGIGLRASQIVALASVVIGIVLLVYGRKKHPDPLYIDLPLNSAALKAQKAGIAVDGGKLLASASHRAFVEAAKKLENVDWAAQTESEKTENAEEAVPDAENAEEKAPEESSKTIE